MPPLMRRDATPLFCRHDTPYYCFIFFAIIADARYATPLALLP